MATEVAPTLEVPAGVDLAAYQHALVERFANPALPHRTQQIAMDGSQKLPQRMLATVRDNLAAGRRIDLLALAVAGWMRYVSGRRRARPRDQGVRSAGRRIRASRDSGVATATRRHSPRGLLGSARSSATTCRRRALFANASAGWSAVAEARRGRRGSACRALYDA